MKYSVRFDLLVSCFAIALVVVRAQFICNSSLVNRRSCTGRKTTEFQCTRYGTCCWDNSSENPYLKCYRKVRGRNSLTMFSATQRPPTDTLFFHRFLSFGGESGYAGSRLLWKCNPQNINIRSRNCRARDRYTCYRHGCCYNSATSRCYSGSYYVLKLRTTCPPGFKNPPRCDDIDECAVNRCVDGGTCTQQINGYTCQCPNGAGDACLRDCTSEPPGVTFGESTVDSSGPWPHGTTVSYTCTSPTPSNAAGGSPVTCDGGIWTGTPPSCQGVCQPPPLIAENGIGGTGIAGVVLTQYNPGQSVMYECVDNYEVYGNDPSSTCQPNTLTWENETPECVPVETDLDLLFVMDSNNNLDDCSAKETTLSQIRPFSFTNPLLTAANFPNFFKQNEFVSSFTKGYRSFASGPSQFAIRQHSDGCIANTATDVVPKSFAMSTDVDTVMSMLSYQCGLPIPVSQFVCAVNTFMVGNVMNNVDVIIYISSRLAPNGMVADIRALPCISGAPLFFTMTTLESTDSDYQQDSMTLSQLACDEGMTSCSRFLGSIHQNLKTILTNFKLYLLNNR